MGPEDYAVNNHFGETNKTRDLEQQMKDMLGWWANIAEDDAKITVPKAVQYGAADLEIMGAAMISLAPEFWSGADETERQQIGREMAVAFYLLGKVARMFGAYQQGTRPSDDTLFDTRIYAMMLQRIRETGSWVK